MKTVSPSPRPAHPRLVLNLKVVGGAGGVRNGDITARRNLERKWKIRTRESETVSANHLNSTESEQ